VTRINLVAYRCDSLTCGYEWIPKRQFDVIPTRCPVCAIDNWDEAPAAMSAQMTNNMNVVDNTIIPDATVNLSNYSFTDKVKAFFKRLFRRN